MIAYIIRRIILLPVTLFAIILINFIILNLAPGDPAMRLDVSSTGEASRAADAQGALGENPYLQFREHYGLTLPILLNLWPRISPEKVHAALEKLAQEKESLSVQNYFKFRTLWGDRARFVMPDLVEEMNDTSNAPEVRRMAATLLIRGGTRQGYVGPSLTKEQKAFNRKVAADNTLLYGLRISEGTPLKDMEKKIAGLDAWYAKNTPSSLSGWEKAKTLLFETRFFRYVRRVVTLDFGTLRNDANKTVINEVGKRIKYSLTLAVIPMFFTFFLCQIFGMMMAVKHNRWPDISLNILFLILFAIPIFVVAPFLIENVALPRNLPFSGFHSPEEVYRTLTSPQRFANIALHIFLPLTAIIYGTLAVQARISRTAVLEVLRQDYVRTARAKGLPRRIVLVKHVGRNAAITIVTSLAASFGVILGGSLIVETIFEINGFGRFFYEAILNRDFNVVLFSAFAGSFLTLIGYLIADISYTLLDPRISLEK